MSNFTTVSVDFQCLVEAFKMLKLHTKPGNDNFKEVVRERAAEGGFNANALLNGLSQSTIKSVHSGTKTTFKNIPQALATIIFSLTGIDVTKGKSIEAFSKLGFDIRLDIDVESRNSEPHQPDQHDLRNFFFQIHEANATVEDPDDPTFELDLRIGFDRVRMTIRAEKLKVTSNEVCAETPRDPTQKAPKDYTGWFQMRLANRNPLSWVFLPNMDGKTLDKRVDATNLVRIETERGTPIIAELTVMRDALKVRMVSGNEIKPNKSIAESHRNKMCAVVAKRSIAGSADEYVIFRKPLLGSSQ